MFEKEGWFFGCIGLLVYAVLIVAIASVCSGWAISVLWAWFVTPKFGLPFLSIAEAVGLSLVVGALTAKSHAITQKGQTGETDWLRTCMKAAVLAVTPPLISVGFGWIILQFV